MRGPKRTGTLGGQTGDMRETDNRAKGFS